MTIKIIKQTITLLSHQALQERQYSEALIYSGGLLNEAKKMFWQLSETVVCFHLNTKV